MGSILDSINTSMCNAIEKKDISLIDATLPIFCAQLTLEKCIHNDSLLTNASRSVMFKSINQDFKNCIFLHVQNDVISQATEHDFEKLGFKSVLALMSLMSTYCKSKLCGCFECEKTNMFLTSVAKRLTGKTVTNDEEFSVISVFLESLVVTVNLVEKKTQKTCDAVFVLAKAFNKLTTYNLKRVNGIICEMLIKWRRGYSFIIASIVHSGAFYQSSLPQLLVDFCSAILMSPMATKFLVMLKFGERCGERMYKLIKCQTYMSFCEEKMTFKQHMHTLWPRMVRCVELVDDKMLIDDDSIYNAPAILHSCDDVCTLTGKRLINAVIYNEDGKLYERDAIMNHLVNLPLFRIENDDVHMILTPCEHKSAYNQPQLLSECADAFVESLMVL